MSQAFKNMSPLFEENRRLELLGGIVGAIWIIAGLFSDPFLLFGSISAGVIIFAILLFESTIGTRKGFNVNTGAFRRTLTAGIAHWAYTSGANAGPATFSFVSTTIPIEELSSAVLVIFLLIWFGTRSYDVIRDTNISDTIIPLVIARSLLRGAILVGLVYAIFSKNQIPDELAFPYLFIIYLVEPFVYMFYQNFNRTYSRVEHNFGNARLPIIAIRESLLSNTIFLMFTFWFNGVEGDEWQLLRMAYIIGLVVVIVYSYDTVKQFSKFPLGDDILGEFLRYTPDTLDNLDLNSEFGHVVSENLSINLSNSSELQLDEGAIIVPLEKTKKKVNALIIGQGASIIHENGTKVAENLNGVTTALIPLKEMDEISSKFVLKQLSSLDFNQLELPSLEKIQSLVASLSINMENWATAIADQLGKLKLSNYSITTEGDNTMVNLPGIFVNESPENTQVKVLGIKVFESPDVTTVKIGNWLNVVEFPKASFVSLPGITVFDVDHIGSAVSVFGLKVSDGIPADRLDEFRSLMLQYMDNLELGLDTQLGRILADRNATGLMHMSLSGEFKPLLKGKTRAVGDHPALKSSQQARNLYLPGNFPLLESSKTSDTRSGFVALTGVGEDPVVRDVAKIKKRIDKSIRKIDRLERKRDRLIDRYDDELQGIDQKEYKARIKEINRKISLQDDRIAKLREKLRGKQALLEEKDVPQLSASRRSEMTSDGLRIIDTEYAYEDEPDNDADQ